MSTLCVITIQEDDEGDIKSLFQPALPVARPDATITLGQLLATRMLNVAVEAGAS